MPMITVQVHDLQLAESNTAWPLDRGLGAAMSSHKPRPTAVVPSASGTSSPRVIELTALTSRRKEHTMTTTMITTEADDVIDRLADAIWYLDQLYFDELDDSVNAEYVDLTRESLGWLIEALLRALPDEGLPPSIELRLRGLRSQV